MKTKLLTFLLALTFLFLLSGNSFGGVFDKEGESVYLYCPAKGIQKNTYLIVNAKDKIITEYKVFLELKKSTYKIEKENEVFLFGFQEREGVLWKVRINKHAYKNIIHVQFKTVNKQKLEGIEDYHVYNPFECTKGDKIF